MGLAVGAVDQGGEGFGGDRGSSDDSRANGHDVGARRVGISRTRWWPTGEKLWPLIRSCATNRSYQSSPSDGISRCRVASRSPEQVEGHDHDDRVVSVTLAECDHSVAVDHWNTM